MTALCVTLIISPGNLAICFTQLATNCNIIFSTPEHFYDVPKVRRNPSVGKHLFA